MKNNGKFFFPASDQYKYIDDNGHLNIPATNPLSLWSNITVDCVKARSSFDVFPTKFSETQGKGWFVLFKPTKNENGINYNKLTLIYDDLITKLDDSYGTFRFITILPVNDAPIIAANDNNGNKVDISYDKELFIFDYKTFNGSVHVDGNLQIATVVGSEIVKNLGLKFSDEDALDSPEIDFEIKITSRPKTNDGSKSGVFTGFPSVPGATVSSDSIKFKSSIEQANRYVASLNFVTEIRGEYVVTVTVNDNGFTGRYCPPGKDFSLGQRKCPRTSVATLTILADTNVALVAGIATGVGGGVLLLAALGAILGSKYLKPTETDAWTEWDEDKLGDVALKNPFYQQDTQMSTSPIYNNVNPPN